MCSPPTVTVPTTPPLAAVARNDIRSVLELVQLDRPGAARAVALKMRCLADDALLAGHRETREHALAAAAAADYWDAGVDTEAARSGIVCATFRIARALAFSICCPTT
jgi:hypothetical protein